MLTAEKEFKKEYLGFWTTNNKEIKVCGECKFYSNGCTTSKIENKYGNSKTPACLEFESK